MKYLITGGCGFVGGHLIQSLSAQGHDIVSIDALAPKSKFKGVEFLQMSLTDQKSLFNLLDRFQPERIIHLASASSVAFSWEQPVECFINNTNIFLNLVEVVRNLKIPCRILSVGSSEEYGDIKEENLPLKEECKLSPLSPYSVARVAQEHLSKVYVRGYGLNIVCTRSFNHLGTGQSDRFVVSSFVRQAVEVRRGRRSSILCGNIDIIRDFLDVRDVVKAYHCILDKGITGEVYNVCSGQGVSLREVLDRICFKLGIKNKYEQDLNLIRPIDSHVIIGNNKKLKDLGFEFNYDLDQSLEDLIVYWENELDA